MKVDKVTPKRVQIPAYTDHWMKGDRYGEVIKTGPRNPKFGTPCDLHTVKLDKSGKTVKVIAADCTEV